MTMSEVNTCIRAVSAKAKAARFNVAKLYCFVFIARRSKESYDATSTLCELLDEALNNSLLTYFTDRSSLETLNTDWKTRFSFHEMLKWKAR